MIWWAWAVKTLGMYEIMSKLSRTQFVTFTQPPSALNHSIITMSGTVTLSRCHSVCSSKLRLVLSIRLHSYHDLFSTAISTSPFAGDSSWAIFSTAILLYVPFLLQFKTILKHITTPGTVSTCVCSSSDWYYQFNDNSCLLAPRFQPPFANYDSEVHHERYSLQPSYHMCPSRMTPPTRMHNPSDSQMLAPLTTSPTPPRRTMAELMASTLLCSTSSWIRRNFNPVTNHVHGLF